jgi:hypothetical protein
VPLQIQQTACTIPETTVTDCVLARLGAIVLVATVSLQLQCPRTSTIQLGPFRRGCYNHPSPLGFDVPVEYQTDLSYLGHRPGISSLGHVRASSAGACAMPCPRWAHAHAHASDPSRAREIVRVCSDTKCDALGPAHGIGPLCRGVNPTYIATRLRFRPRFT